MEPTRMRRSDLAWIRVVARCVVTLLVALAPGARPSAASQACTLADVEWRHYRSRHFVFDVAARDLEPALLVKTFEELHAAVLAGLIAEPVEIPGRVRVIVLPRERDLPDYTGDRRFIGLFWISSYGEPTILVSADRVRDLPHVVAHELAHHVSSYLFPRQAYWFAEGLAQFLEGVAKVDRHGRRWAGGDPESGWFAGSVKLRRMESLVGGYDSPSFDENPFVTSWILYRFLWNERGAQLARYQQRLMEGDAPVAAWDTAFPEWSVDGGRIRRLNDEVARHQRSGRGRRWQIELGPVDAAFTSAPPSPGDLHLALLPLRLPHVSPLLVERTKRKLLEEAEREEPGHPVVRVELARLRGEPALPALRAAVAARPADGRGWFLLAAETDYLAEREAALRRAVAQWPDGALAKASLASHLAATGRAREALPFANQATDLAPWSPAVVSTLATVAAELGKCKEAIVLQERAVDLGACGSVASAGFDPALLRKRLAEVRERCAPAAP